MPICHDKKIILHIGRHKTGTTAIQHALFNSRKSLLKKNILVPGLNSEIFQSYQALHHEFAKYFLENSNTILNQEFISQIEAHSGTVLISSEGFQNIHNPYKIKNFFRNQNIKIIVYLREQLEYILSSYAQEVKASNYSRSLTEYIENSNLDYRVFLKRWECFGKENLVVRIYDRKKLINNNSVDDFRYCAKLPGDIQYARDIVNPSLESNLLLLKLLLNHFFPNINTIAFYKAYSLFLKNSNQLNRIHSKFKTRRNIADAIRKKYHKSNMLLSKDYFNGEEIFEYKDFTSDEPCDYESLYSDAKYFFEVINKFDPLFVDAHSVILNSFKTGLAKTILRYVGF